MSAAKGYDSRVALFEKECARLRREGGAEEDAPDAIGKHVSAYRHLLTNLSQIHPHARLAVCSLLPTRAGRRHINASVDKLNAELAELAQAQGGRLLEPARRAPRERSQRAVQADVPVSV